MHNNELIQAEADSREFIDRKTKPKRKSIWKSIKGFTIKRRRYIMDNVIKNGYIKTIKHLKGDQQMRSSNKINTNDKAKKVRNFTPVLSLLMLLVVVSIAFSSYVVYFGTSGLIPKIMLVPQALFAATIAISKFTK